MLAKDSCNRFNRASVLKWAVLVCAVLLLECTFFNYPYWITNGSNPIQILSEEPIRITNFDSEESTSTANISDSGDAAVSLDEDVDPEYGIVADIDSIDPDAEIDESSSEAFDFNGSRIVLDEPLDITSLELSANYSCKIIVYYTCEGSSFAYNTYERDYFTTVPESKYIQFNSSGKVESIAFDINRRLVPDELLSNNEIERDTIDLSVTANSVIPFTFSWIRVLGIIGIALLIWAFSSKRRIYTENVFDNGKMTRRSKGATIAITCIVCALFIVQLTIMPSKLGSFGEGYSSVTLSNQTSGTITNEKLRAGLDTSGLIDEGSSALTPLYDRSPLAYIYPRTYESEYAKLARSFAVGRLDLLDEPSIRLEEFDNPYDYSERYTLVQTDDIADHWDTAYFNGRYYVYFGVLPVVILYLPYHLITGQDLPNFIAIVICLVALIAGTSLLITRIARRYFPRISLGILLLSLVIVLTSSQLVWLLVRASIYGVPISMGLALLVWSTVCMISLDRHPLLVIPGALLAALVFACRPQIGLFGFALIPFGVQALRAQKDTRSRIIYLALALLPVILVLIAIGAYNNARFGNPLDFGSAYNLTTNDMRVRPLSLKLGVISLFYYFLCLPVINFKFPFIQNIAENAGDMEYMIEQQWNYAGYTVAEPMIGGVIWLAPIIILSIVLMIRNTPKTMKMLICAVIFIAFVVAIVDGELAGILPRYVLDFSLPLTILGVCGLMKATPIVTDGACMDYQGRLQEHFIRFAIACMFIGLLTCVAVAFNSSALDLSVPKYELQELVASIDYQIMPN